MKRKYKNDDFRQINRKFRRKLKYNDLIAMKGKQFNIRHLGRILSGIQSKQ